MKVIGRIMVEVSVGGGSGASQYVLLVRLVLALSNIFTIQSKRKIILREIPRFLNQ